MVYGFMAQYLGGNSQKQLARPIVGNLFLSRVERELLERFH